MKFEVIDLFCGAGGVTTGIEAARYKRSKIANVIACINHDPIAIKSHAANHKGVLHFTEDIKTFDVTRFPKWSTDTITCLWASLECTNFSKAKGGKPRDGDSRTLANHMFKYLEHLKPDYFLVENVEEFEAWGALDENGKPVSKDNGRAYRRWCNRVESMGYVRDRRKLNAADFGANTIRKRLFICFAKTGFPIAWPQPTHTKVPDMYIKNAWKPVKECLDFGDEGKSIFTRKKPLSEKTLERIYAGLMKFIAGGDETFIIKWLGNNAKTGINDGKSVNDPCSTVTTQNRLGIVNVSKAFIKKILFRSPKR
ncbi:MAG: DNA-cytosine methyltransferase [Chlorobi bacterium OLB5]|nr:MAG: DNA-cytosine methyltransferase [Chlorobi bacterium OLB5]